MEEEAAGEAEALVVEEEVSAVVGVEVSAVVGVEVGAGEAAALAAVALQEIGNDYEKKIIFKRKSH